MMDKKELMFKLGFLNKLEKNSSKVKKVTSFIKNVGDDALDMFIRKPLSLPRNIKNLAHKHKNVKELIKTKAKQYSIEGAKMKRSEALDEVIDGLGGLAATSGIGYGGYKGFAVRRRKTK